MVTAVLGLAMLSMGYEKENVWGRDWDRIGWRKMLHPALPSPRMLNTRGGLVF